MRTSSAGSTLHYVFREHFGRFAAEYDSRYAKELGDFRLERISRVASRFLACGDYRQGDDNPYSDALFHIVKYRPECPPVAFRGPEQARGWVEVFAE